MDSSGTDNDDECYALITTHGEDVPFTDKVEMTIFLIDTDNLSQLKSFLYSLYVNFKNKSIENVSLIVENKELKKVIT